MMIGIFKLSGLGNGLLKIRKKLKLCVNLLTNRGLAELGSSAKRLDPNERINHVVIRLAPIEVSLCCLLLHNYHRLYTALPSNYNTFTATEK